MTRLYQTHGPRQKGPRSLSVRMARVARAYDNCTDCDGLLARRCRLMSRLLNGYHVGDVMRLARRAGA